MPTSGRSSAVTRRRANMTSSDERVAAEIGRALLMLFRAGMQVRLWPDALSGRASARIVAGPTARRRHAAAPRSASGNGSGDSPLTALYAAVERMNERAGTILVQLD